MMKKLLGIAATTALAFVVMNASLAQEAHGITIRARQTH